KEDNTAGKHVNTASSNVNTGSPAVNIADTIVNPASHEDIPTTPHTRIHRDHPPENVIGDIQSSVQTRRSTTEQGFLSAIEPNRVTKDLSDPAWVEAMQEELLQFEL
ncbi:hypothetical protein Tco_0176610, partial [Tanacetum coccineum]